MEVLVLDQNFKSLTIIDTFKSLIWTDRYNAYGDFELYLAMDSSLFSIIQKDYYLWMKDSDHVMIIEKYVIDTDAETGNFMTVTGRSLESILDRRIIWKQKQFTGKLQDAIKTMLEDAIISPEIPERKIDNFIFEESDDPKIIELSIDAQYTGDNLYEVIQSLCEAAHIGFRIRLNDNNQFVFKLYSGMDRSYSQDTNPYVVFSQGFDNLINSNFLDSNENLKNVTLVAGEGEGSERKTTIVGSESGLIRRELYTDARDISSKTDDGDLTEEQYISKLQQRGTKKLSECQTTVAFDGETEASAMFRYGEDYFIGDVVEVEDVYGNQGRSYVSEFIFSQDDSGTSAYPTFQTT